MQVETSRKAVESMSDEASFDGRQSCADMLLALLSERDAATARAEGAENALFTLRNRAGCGPDQSGPDVWQQRDAARAERDAVRDLLAQARREGMLAAAEIAASGKEIMRDGGYTEVEDMDADEIVAAILAAAKEGA